MITTKIGVDPVSFMPTMIMNDGAHEFRISRDDIKDLVDEHRTGKLTEQEFTTKAVDMFGSLYNMIQVLIYGPF